LIGSSFVTGTETEMVATASPPEVTGVSMEMEAIFGEEIAARLYLNHIQTEMIDLDGYINLQAKLIVGVALNFICARAQTFHSRL